MNIWQMRKWLLLEKMLIERYEGKNKPSKKVNDPIDQNDETPVKEEKQQKGKKRD